MRSGRLFSLVLSCGILAAAGTAFGQTNPPTKQSAPAKSAAAASSYDKALLSPSSLTAKAPETFEVKFTTTQGDFTIKVTRAWTPLGADRFYNLARHHFFDGGAFFRVLPGFVVQFGLSPYPAVSKAWSNAVIHDDPVKQSNKRGFVTYAMGGPNTRTTQVFISFGDNSRLDKDGFSPFGEVTEGMDVVVKLYGGYGDMPDMGGRGPSPALIERQGKAYLEKNFPKIDWIKTAVITSPAPAAPAAKTPAKSAPKTPAKKAS